MTIKPLGLRVMIKMVEEEDAEVTTASGLVLPESAKEKPQIAEVVAVGDGVTDEGKFDMLVEVGDKVIVSKYAGTEITLDDEDYKILDRDDVLAIVED